MILTSITIFRHYFHYVRIRPRILTALVAVSALWNQSSPRQREALPRRSRKNFCFAKNHAFCAARRSNRANNGDIAGLRVHTMIPTRLPLEQAGIFLERGRLRRASARRPGETEASAAKKNDCQ